jgi:hypothetical protein
MKIRREIVIGVNVLLFKSEFILRFSSVRLKREEIQLVAVVTLFGNVVVARKGVLQGHLLEPSERQNL